MKAPVWLWPAGCATPVQVGSLERDEATGAGSFLYDSDYVKSGNLALDPGQLRHLSARQPIPIPATAREGIPGLIADAGPDSWGRLVLAQNLGFEPNALEALVHSADDGAGNLAVGDLGAKPPLAPLDLEHLADVIGNRHGGAATDNRVLDLLSPDTALGGAKPKATVIQDGHLWIAKFPERGDPVNLPYYEAAALRMAERVGIPSAQVIVRRLPQSRSVLLVKRFDRAAGGLRLGFASALTVMGPQAQALGPFRTYLNLAKRLKPWLLDETATGLTQLWERIAFNALVANGDDHPRNHGLLNENGRWRLSPAFDIVPTYLRRERLSLAMPFFRLASGKETSLVTVAHLVQSAPAYGVDSSAALARLIAMADDIVKGWAAILDSLAAPASVTEETQPLLAWVCHIQGELAKLTSTDLIPPREKVGRRWHWVP